MLFCHIVLDPRQHANRLSQRGSVYTFTYNNNNNKVMDALLHAVETMHDDLEVVLITYSSKISVYR